LTAESPALIDIQDVVGTAALFSSLYVLDRSGNARTLARGTYAYQLTTTNQNGTFKQSKVLTVQ
jgi:hypothetical protein